MNHLRNLIVDGRIKKALFLLKNQQISSIELIKKDPENNTPLHWAVKLRYPEIIESLLNTDAHLCKSIKNQQGLTPYDIAKQTRLSSQLLLKLRAKEMVAANSDRQRDIYTQLT